MDKYMRVFNVYTLSSLAVRIEKRSLLGRVNFMSLFDYADNNGESQYRRLSSNTARIYSKYYNSLSHKVLECTLDSYDGFNDVLRNYTHDANSHGVLSYVLHRYRIW